MQCIAVEELQEKLLQKTMATLPVRFIFKFLFIMFWVADIFWVIISSALHNRASLSLLKTF